MPRRLVILKTSLAGAMLLISVTEFINRPSELAEGLIIDRDYWRITIYSVWALFILWSLVDPFKKNRKRTIDWDQSQMIVSQNHSRVEIKWEDVDTLKEDQIAFHVFRKNKWRGFELLKFGLPSELLGLIHHKRQQAASPNGGTAPRRG